MEVESGRYSKTEPQDRLCPFCKTLGKIEIEDEAHFLIRCPQYKELRERYLPLNILGNNDLTDERKMINILKNSECYKSLAKFTYQAFEERKDNLEIIKTIEDMIDLTEINAAIPNPEYTISKLSTCGLKMTIEKNSPSHAQKSYEIVDSSNNGMKVTLAKVIDY